MVSSVKMGVYIFELRQLLPVVTLPMTQVVKLFSSNTPPPKGLYEDISDVWSLNSR